LTLQYPKYNQESESQYLVSLTPTQKFIKSLLNSRNVMIMSFANGFIMANSSFDMVIYPLRTTIWGTFIGTMYSFCGVFVFALTPRYFKWIPFVLLFLSLVINTRRLFNSTDILRIRKYVNTGSLIQKVDQLFA
jgi:hypothetical protein